MRLRWLGLALAFAFSSVCGLTEISVPAAQAAAAPPATRVPATSTPAAHAAPAPSGRARCPILVLDAMPLEADPILAHSRVDPRPVYTYGGRGFWSGTVEGNRAVFALTGIGIVNATRTTEAAFAHFDCFSAVVFSGTSGGDYIGDVMVPTRWTQDGKHFLDTSPEALAALKR